MYILPINPQLPNIIDKLVIESKTLPFGNHQLNIPPYIINIKRGVAECIQLDDHGTVIDGFVLDITNNKYRGKTFYELLGGTDFEESIVANPIR